MKTNNPLTSNNSQEELIDLLKTKLISDIRQLFNEFFENRIEEKGKAHQNLSDKYWLTTAEAAVYLGTSGGSIRNQVHRGQLIAKKRLGRLYFRRTDLDRLIEISKKGGL